jgi:hypothetical protein
MVMRHGIDVTEMTEKFQGRVLSILKSQQAYD